MNHAVLFLVAASSLTFALRPLAAQDRVLLQQAGGSRIPLTGFVEEYTGRELVLRLKPDDPVRRYPRSDVVEVVTEFTPHHERARKLLAAAKIDDAKKEYAAALDEENRDWVRREILAGQIKCALWTGDYVTAVTRFLLIIETDRETFHYNLAPLNWTDEMPPANLRSEARRWILPTALPASKLMGASWLLTVPESRIDVEILLKRLAREPDVRVQRLAQMQLWRFKLSQTELVDSSEIQRWERFVEGIAAELRGGSYFVIGEAWKQRQEYERAARAFLWLPLVYQSDHWLSSRACFEAADSMELSGDVTNAVNLYSEVVFRYGDTRWAPAAETAWKGLRQKNSAP